LQPEKTSAPNIKTGHGGDPVTSVILYLYPSLVKLDKVDWRGVKTPIEGLESINHSTHIYKGVKITIPLMAEEITESGIQGDPKYSSPERGEILFEALINYLLDFLNHFKSLTI
jgi:creatinine amidohydrolase